MLTHEEIVKAVAKAATKFPLTKVSYFGSYADGKAKEESDLDLLVEFGDDGSLTLLDIIDFRHNLEDELSIRVDVVEVPLTEKAQKRLKIKKAVPVYERT
ncbi:MAG: nucleotidyltransferase domain-containing protein [Methanomicrobiales archaeon]|jgi:predicted nucleotidyltransferase|nr:nucleotidyltransferase domain-containing protein [Methanomicrobiales archaeon]